MRAVLDAAPDQAVPPHRSRAFQRRRPRVAATQVRTERAAQALIITCIGEVVATLRVRGDREIVLIRRQIDRATTAPTAHHLGRHQILMVFVIGTVERLRGRRQITTKRRHVLVELAEDHVGSVHPQLERLGRLRPRRAGLILVAQQELARFQWTPPAVRLLHAIARIPGRVRALDRRLRDWIGKTKMLALGADPVFMRERLRILNEPNLDTANRFHFGANDSRRFFAALIGIGANPGHRVNVGTAETALPMFRRVRPDIAHDFAHGPASRRGTPGESCRAIVARARASSALRK